MNSKGQIDLLLFKGIFGGGDIQLVITAFGTKYKIRTVPLRRSVRCRREDVVKHTHNLAI
jgi:hypothetical protein